MKYIFVENGVLNGAGEAEQLDENVLNIEVSEDVYRAYLDDSLKFIFAEGQIVQNPNYEKDKEKSLNSARISEIKRLLEDIDTKRIRAICENEIKDTETGEMWLDYYNSQVLELRNELKSLEGSV